MSAEWMEALKNGDYIDFSKGVKAEINTRYVNHPVVKDVKQRNDYYNSLATYFANAPVNAPLDASNAPKNIDTQDSSMNEEV